MAEGLYRKFKERDLTDGGKLLEHDIRAILLDDTYVFDVTDASYFDVQSYEISTGGDYIAGGKSLTGKSVENSGAGVVFKAANLVWANLENAVIRYLVLYDNTEPTKPLISCHEFNRTYNIPAGRLEINWSEEGVFKLK